jgi:hypothetical protein
MKKFIPLVVLLTSLLVPSVTQPQGAPNSDGPRNIFHDELLDHMVGVWHLSGSVMGDTADHHVLAGGPSLRGLQGRVAAP